MKFLEFCENDSKTSTAALLTTACVCGENASGDWQHQQQQQPQ